MSDLFIALGVRNERKSDFSPKPKVFSKNLQKEVPMLFMITFTGEPGRQNETLKRAVERRNVSYEGIKVIGSWVYPGAHKAFTVCEAKDAAALTAMTLPWSDLGQYEIVPVIELEELRKMVSSPK